MDNYSVDSSAPCIPFATLGWDDQWEADFARYAGPYLPGRVLTAHKTRYDVWTREGVRSLPVSGAMKAKKILPVVGDFVVILSDPDSGTEMIVACLPRRGSLTRGGCGENSGEQVIAANIDTAFIITDHGHDFSIPRLIRYLLIVRASGAEPVILLNKADTCEDIRIRTDEIHREISDVPVFPISALHSEGFQALEPYLVPGKTVIFLGSSGVGKSTLMNAFLGSDLQKIGEVREDDGKGKHTTTVRHMEVLTSGCCLIDTPGMREIRIWTAGECIDEEFSDIVRFAGTCRFSDCSHQDEPGCAVIRAIQEGALNPDRLTQYRRMLKEIEFERNKADIGLKRLEKQRWQGVSELGKNYREKKRWLQNR